MKKIILLFVAVLSLNTSIIAQEELKEGVLTIKMTMSSENEQVNAAFAMIGDINMVAYFKGNKSRAEQSNSMTGNNTSIVDMDAKKMLMLMDNPMAGKQYMEQELDVKPEDLEKVTVTETGDTKTLAGYECKGYNVEATVKGVSTKMTLYTTEKIIAPNQNTATFSDKVKGYPLYMVMNMTQGGMPLTMTMEVTDVKAENVEDSKFDMTVPEGYTKMELPKPANVD